jgi:hypothetical protein
MLRIIAGAFLVATLAAHLLLGVGSLLSSKYEEFKAKTEAGDLADVAGDLVDEETLAKERAKTAARADTSGARQKLVLGVVLLAAAGAQLLGAILLFAGRGRRIVLSLVAVSMVPAIVTMVVSGVSILGAISVVVLALVLVLVFVFFRPSAASVG